MSVSALSQNGQFVVDTTQSEVAFKISHLGPFKVKGTFDQYSGKFQFQDDIFKSLEARVTVSSVNTGNDERDEILETEPYFDIANFPDIIFSADRIDLVDGENIIYGKLTIKDQQRDLSMPVSIDHKPGSGRLLLTAETRIRRKDYDLVFGSMNGLIGDKVDIYLTIVALKD